MIRQGDVVVSVVRERMEAEPRDDISHLREAKILPEQLEAVSVVNRTDLALPLGQHSGRGIVEVDLPHDLHIL